MTNIIGRARNARLNQANKHLSELIVNLRALRGFPASRHIEDKYAWADGRDALEQIVQCFHEANAYNNSMEPRGPTVTTSDFDSENPGSSPGAAAT